MTVDVDAVSGFIAPMEWSASVWCDGSPRNGLIDPADAKRIVGVVLAAADRVEGRRAGAVGMAAIVVFAVAAMAGWVVGIVIGLVT